MKIVEWHDILNAARFARSSVLAKAWWEVQAAIAATDWPHGSGTFTIYPQSGKKRGQGNGVVPIKIPCVRKLLELGWQRECLPRIRGGVLTCGELDAMKLTKKGGIAFKWETGNISSSHRAINKLLLTLQVGGLLGGFLVVPSNADPSQHQQLQSEPRGDGARAFCVGAAWIGRTRAAGTPPTALSALKSQEDNPGTVQHPPGVFIVSTSSFFTTSKSEFTNCRTPPIRLQCLHGTALVQDKNLRMGLDAVNLAGMGDHAHLRRHGNPVRRHFSAARLRQGRLDWVRGRHCDGDRLAHRGLLQDRREASLAMGKEFITET
jgi:hypothetical protein